MARMLAWTRSGRGLVALFLMVTVLPAAALVALGVRLLEQERVLAEQRRRESLEHAADQAVRILEQELAALRQSLRAGGGLAGRLPGDSAFLRIRGGAVETSPAGRLPYLPAGAALREAPDAPFAAADALEFGRQEYARALEVNVGLARSADAAIRAGALLRQARILRKMGRSGEALAVNRSLARIEGVGLGAMPIDLLARRSVCALLAEMSRPGELAEEAARIRDDLKAGRWRLDEASYEHAAAQVGGWLGREIRPSSEQAALARAAAWIHSHAAAAGDGNAARGGAQFVPPVLVVWEREGGSVAAVLAGPALVEARLMGKARAAVGPAVLQLGGKAAGGGTGVSRSAAETGLPWGLTLMNARGAPVQDATRGRLIAASFASLLLLIGAGSYLTWRAVSRELAVARLQSDFVAAVSHEFRTPLTTLAHLNDLLSSREEPGAERRRGYYQAQSRATDRLRRLVETLLDFGRMEAGRQPYRFEPVDAGAFARDVAQAFSAEVAERGFQVEVRGGEEELPVLADPEALERALWNLLDNAAKYSGESRKIVVSTARSGREVRIAVSDAGLGIDAEDQRKIFEKFARGEAARRHGIKGTGIGLTMVRHIMEAHGGKVKVESAKGRGSTFSMVLPVRE